MAKTGAAGPKIKPAAWIIMLVVLAALAGVLINALFVLRIIGLEGIGYFYGLVFVASVAASIGYWRALDEPSREAHKSAVFWGLGMAYAIVALIGFELMVFRGAREVLQGWVEGWIAFTGGIFGTQQGAVGVYLGICASTILLTLGYTFVWIGWWVRQRMGTKAD